MSYSDPTFPATGFEGLIIADRKATKVGESLGFEGIVVSNRSTNFPKIPAGFEGIIIEYKSNQKFIKVVTSKGLPFKDCQVTVNQTPPFSSMTDESGFISGIFSASGIVPIVLKSGNTFYEFSINTANQPLVSTLVFPLDYL